MDALCFGVMDLDPQTLVELIDPDDDYIPFPMSVPGPIENPVQPAHFVPLVFPVIARGRADSREAVVDTNVFHGVHDLANEFLLIETTKSLGLELLGELRPCTGFSMAKGYRTPITSSTKSRAAQKLGRVFVHLSGPKIVHSLQGKRYVMIVKNDFTRYYWVYFLERKSGAADAFRKVWLMCVRMVCRRR